MFTGKKKMFSLQIRPKIGLIYYNKFQTFNLIISNNSFPSAELLDRTNVVCVFKCPLGDCVCNKNNTYVGLTTTTLSRRLKMHLNDSSSVAQHLKIHSVPKSKFRKDTELHCFKSKYSFVLIKIYCWNTYFRIKVFCIDVVD